MDVDDETDESKNGFDDEADEWFLKSIKSYGKLQMFELPNVIRNVLFYDPNLLCLLTKNEGSLEYELSALEFPQENDPHLTFKGIIKFSSDSNHVQIKLISNTKRILVSLNTKLCAYNLQDGGEASFLIYQVASKDHPYRNPRMAVSGEGDHIILCERANHISVLTRTLEKDHQICYNSKYMRLEPIFPFFLTNHLVCFGNERGGSLYTNDLRSSEKSVEIFHPPDADKAFNWRFDSSYESRKEEGFIYGCNLKKFYVYDCRNTRQPAKFGDLPDAHKACNYKFKVSDDRFFISGCDRNVRIYETKPGLLGKMEVSKRFTHIGHKFDDESPLETLNYSTNSIWVPHLQNGVISILSKSLHLWQFK